MFASNHFNSWIAVRNPNPRALLRLFCFPYAGGGTSVFSAWSSVLPPQIEVCAVIMPGRERRLGEPPIACLDRATGLLAAAIVQFLDRPFAFFGHSLGAVLAFELARRLRLDGASGLVHLFVGGRAAPHLPLDDPPICNLPAAQFLQELRRFAGTPREVLENPEMMAMFMPLLRADFSMGETYSYREATPLEVPISAYGGLQDGDVPEAKLDQWRQHTASRFRRVMFPGGHFFLNENREAVLSELTRELQETIVRV